MPNLNVKGETPRAASSASAGGGGGVPKVVIIFIIVVVVLVGAAFVLNTTGIVKLWGKKKAQPVLVSTPTENLPPVTQEQILPPVDTAAVNPAVEENITKLESNAGINLPVQPKKSIVTGTGMFTIQISSWPTQEKAERQAQVFSDAGFEAFVEPLGSYYRVCIGRYESKSAAKTQAEKMEHMLESMPVIAKVGK